MRHCQTWLVGNTVTDILIVTAMLYYVKTLQVVRGSCTDCYSSGHQQLTRRRNADDGLFSNHALVKIVRLTVETNILTSMCALVSGRSNHLTHFQPPTGS